MRSFPSTARCTIFLLPVSPIGGAPSKNSLWFPGPSIPMRPGSPSRHPQLWTECQSGVGVEYSGTTTHRYQERWDRSVKSTRRPTAGPLNPGEKRMLGLVRARGRHARGGHQGGTTRPRRTVEVSRPVRLEQGLHGLRRQAGGSGPDPHPGRVD